MGTSASSGVRSLLYSIETTLDLKKVLFDILASKVTSLRQSARSRLIRVPHIAWNSRAHQVNRVRY